MAFEQWVIVRAQCLGWIGAGDGLVEQFAHSDSIDISSVNEIAVLETRNETDQCAKDCPCCDPASLATKVPVHPSSLACSVLREYDEPHLC